MHFVSDLIQSVSGLFGLSIKEFTAQLFSGFSYFDKIMLMIGVFVSLYKLISDFIFRLV